MTEVALRGITKRFGGVEVIHGIDLDIENGEFVVLVGPSGCGKSTLLRLIAGLEDITEGDLLIDGRRVNKLTPKERNISMVFQNYALYPHLSVRGNMSFSLQLAKTAKATIDEEVDKASGILGLAPLLERLPRQLSGGQRQRVAMGRAIVRDPSVFLFDEPLSNLDAKLRVQMRAEIRNLHERLEATTIYVTHDQVEAMTMADKIVIMRDGHIEQIGSPLDLYNNPANLFVATFLGSPEMNLLPGVVAGSGFDLGKDGHIGFDAPLRHGVREVTLGVRPHDVDLCAEKDGHLAAEVAFIERTGAETILTCALPSGKTMSIVTTAQAAVENGHRVGLRFDQSSLRCFNSETGGALRF